MVVAQAGADPRFSRRGWSGGGGATLYYLVKFHRKLHNKEIKLDRGHVLWKIMDLPLVSAKKFKWIWSQQVGFGCLHDPTTQLGSFIRLCCFPTRTTNKILYSVFQWLQKESVVKNCLFEDDLWGRQGTETSGRTYTPANPEDFPQNPTNTQITVSTVVTIFLSFFGSNLKNETKKNKKKTPNNI